MSSEHREAVAVRDLLESAPRPPDEGLPAGVGNGAIEAFTNRTGVEVPGPLRKWLEVSNGPCVGPGGLFGIKTKRKNLDIEFYYDLFPRWKEKKWIPIAGDGCGNYYVLSTAHEFGAGFPVLFVETSISSDSPAYIVASNIWAFLIFLLEKEISRSFWPFDRDEVTGRDPSIEQYKDVSMPWDKD